MIEGWPILVNVLSGDLWNSMMITGDRRQELLWFLLLGFAWIMAGALLHTYVKNHKEPPSSLYGWALFVQGLAGAIVIPQSGAWLFLPQGVLLIIAQKKND